MENIEINEFKLSGQSIRVLGQAWGIKSNRLSTYLNLPKGGNPDGIEVDESLRSILEILLSPGNITTISLTQRDEGMVNTAVCTSEKGCVSVGMGEMEVTLKGMKIDEFIESLIVFFDNDTVLKTLGTSLVLSRNALYALLAGADLYGINRMISLLEKKPAVDPLTIIGIKGAAAQAINEPDPRWLTSNVLAIDRLTEMFDIDVGIDELCSHGIFEKTVDGVIKLPAPEGLLIPGLAEPEVFSGLRSFYYDEEALTAIGLVVFRTRNFLWGIELTEQPLLISLNVETAFLYFYSLLNRGDYSDGMIPDEEESVDFEENSAPVSSIIRPIHCRNCGNILESNAKLCSKCGATIQKPKSRQDVMNEPIPDKKIHYCAYCGSSLRENVKFCTTCGKAVQVATQKNHVNPD